MKCTEPQEWEWKGLHKPEETGNERRTQATIMKGQWRGVLALHAWQRWQGWIAEVLETEGSTWRGCMRNRAGQWACAMLAMKHRTFMCYWSKQINPRASSCSALSQLCSPIPCLGERQDIRAAETEFTCRKLVTAVAFPVPNRQQLMLSKTLKVNMDACFKQTRLYIALHLTG